MFYNKKNEPVPVESVFDRRERLDVKKPGPFFAHSPNNFFHDKLLPENFDENSDEDNVEEGGEEENGGQTEYELPLSPQTRPKKSSGTVFTIKKRTEARRSTSCRFLHRLDQRRAAAQSLPSRSQGVRTTPSPSTTTGSA